jgi:hypothetical protein
MPDTVPCPKCGAAARITERFRLDSTAGPVEHVKIGCVNNHRLTPPAETVAGAGSEPTPAAVEAVPA